MKKGDKKANATKLVQKMPILTLALRKGARSTQAS